MTPYHVRRSDGSNRISRNTDPNFACFRCVASCKLRTRSLHYCITANLEYPKGSEESTSGTKTSRTTATYRQTEMSPQEPTRHTYSGGGVVPKLNGINSFTWKMEVYNVAVLNGFADVLIGTKVRPRGSPVLEDEDEVVDSDFRRIRAEPV